jgi:hypothetical protein
MLVTESIMKSHVGGVQQGMSFAILKPFLIHAERWFRKQVGVELNAYLTTIPADEPEGLQKDLLWLAQGATVWYGFAMAQPNLHIKVGDTGFAKILPSNHVALTKWEYVKLEESSASMIDLCLEGFWMTLDSFDEEDLPEDWVGSAAFKIRNSLFIRSATELTNFLPLAKGSVRMYEALKNYIKQVEKNYIASLITEQVFEDLKRKCKKEADLVLTNNDVVLIELIGYAVAPLAMYEALPYMSVLVDTEGVRIVVKTDSTRNELEPTNGEKNTLSQKLYRDGEAAIGRIRKFLKEKSSDTVYPSFFTANPSASYKGNILDMDDEQFPIL